MKRMIAIAMTALILALSLIGCGGRNDGNVSDTPNGTINSSSGIYQDGLSRNNPTSDSETTAKNHSDNKTDRFMNDMKDAATDIGDAVGDAVTPGTGMTGGR